MFSSNNLCILIIRERQYTTKQNKFLIEDSVFFQRHLKPRLLSHTIGRGVGIFKCSPDWFARSRFQLRTKLVRLRIPDVAPPVARSFPSIRLAAMIHKLLREKTEHLRLFSWYIFLFICSTDVEHVEEVQLMEPASSMDISPEVSSAHREIRGGGRTSSEEDESQSAVANQR